MLIRPWNTPDNGIDPAASSCTGHISAYNVT